MIIKKKIIEIIKTKIKKDLESNNIKFFMIPNPMQDGNYWGDYPMDKIIDKYGYDILDKDFITFPILINDNNNFDNNDNKIYFSHNLKNEDVVNKVFNIFKKHFGDQFIWNKNNKVNLLINI